MTRATALARVPIQGPTIMGLWVSWEADLLAKNRADATLQNYKESLTQFDAFLIANDLPQEVMAITRDDVRSFMHDLLRVRRMSSTTARMRFACLRAFFNWSVSEGEIVASPMVNMEPPQTQDVPPAILSDDQLRSLFKACAGNSFAQRRDNAILRLLVDTGMRRGECGSLRVQDVDIVSRLATVVGKGNRVRRVSFGSRTAQALDRYLRVRRSHKYAARAELWISQMGPITGDGIASVVKARSGQAGMKTHAHVFRHTYAHNQLRAGQQEGDVMRQAGWRSRAMLSRYSATLADDRSREAYQRIGAPGDRL